MSENVYTDFMDFVKNIKEYLTNNPLAVLSFTDIPQKLRVGYKDEKSEEAWYIPISKVRRWHANAEDNKKNSVLKSLLKSENWKTLLIGYLYEEANDR